MWVCFSAVGGAEELSFSQFGLVVRCHRRVRGIAGATGYCERESDCKERARYDEGKAEHELIECTTQI
jgi:hypothetical protein